MLFLTVFAYGRMFEWYALIAINFCGIYIYIVKGRDNFWQLKTF